jgi:phosphohistidine phosphatase SixA
MATMPVGRWIRTPFVLVALGAWFGSPAAQAQRLSGMDLVHALQDGGYVLVVRNAQSRQEQPEKESDRAPANLHGEREIDEYGQGQMSVLGYAFRQLDIPVDHSLTSPAYRSRQSAKYFGFGEPMVVDSLAESADASWLARRVSEAPPSGQNTVIITHGALITNAFGRDARDIGTAEMLIYQPRDGNAELQARLTVEDWARLATN